ncbi:hypothetical protein [Mucilaginibacter pedocola]|uniref:Uncharacterized protein n=1 Tax=Mucilaginibacter pedocola TaxID=1792845 RepID=A0A1S9PB08_9SPHI|nr:hypothetical protein [Mucilaginibacter pedocola]OOQ58119.1 hypothetical protein BC343_10735 [Mucilaginibacter pedocola]
MFPFFAIITAGFIIQLTTVAELRFFKISQYVICGLLLAVFITVAILFDTEKLWIAILLLLISVISTYFIFRNLGNSYQPALLLSGIVVLMVNAWFLLAFYPAMANYKGDGVAAEYVNTHYPGQQIISTAPMADRFDFYMKQPVAYATVDAIIKSPQPALVFANDASMEQLKKSKLRMQVIKVFDNYFGENITMKFINKATREQALTHFYLIRVEITSV